MDEYLCNDGECIDKSRACDGVSDCYDGDDEDFSLCDLPISGCSHDEFKCSDGYCIATSRVCDGILDCISGEDEDYNCTLFGSTTDRNDSNHDEVFTPIKIDLNQTQIDGSNNDTRNSKWNIES